VTQVYGALRGICDVGGDRGFDISGSGTERDRCRCDAWNVYRSSEAGDGELGRVLGWIKAVYRSKHVAVDWPVKVDSWTSPGEGVWVRISCADRVRDSLNNRCTWWSTRHKIDAHCFPATGLGVCIPFYETGLACSEDLLLCGRDRVDLREG